jgi:glycosyltransferase involved in cell wall biosynthesis
MKVLVVSNMYPSEDKPYWGTFVKECVDGYLREAVDTEIVVIKKSGIIGYIKFYCCIFLKIILTHYDVVHVHYVTHSVLPVLLARIFKEFKVLLNFHGSDAFPEVHERPVRRKLKNIISNVAIKFSDLVIVPSNYFKEKMNSIYELKDVFVSPSGGVDEQLFRFSAEGGKKVLFAGRMLHEKGPVIAANSVKSCWQYLDAAIFIGDGPEKQNVIDMLSSLPVTYLDLLPHAELAKNMALHDIFLFPSTRDGESLGLVVIEAIFSGMIPLVMNNGAMKDIIPDQYHELLIANCEDEYINKLEILLTLSSEERAKISLGVYNQCISSYSAKNVSAALVGRVMGMFDV